MTERDVRRSFVNCSRGESQGLHLPAGFAELGWDDLVVLGWLDPRAPLRGHLVLEREGRPLGTSLRAADTRMSGRVPTMCLLCQTALSGDEASLFTARRAGEAGRNGNTVGTYMCADLNCAERARTEVPPWLRERDPDEVSEERTGELRRRAHAFADAVLAAG